MFRTEYSFQARGSNPIRATVLTRHRPALRDSLHQQPLAARFAIWQGDYEDMQWEMRFDKSVTG